jgi:hypothetical protein
MQAIKSSLAYNLDGDMHAIIPDDQVRSTDAMLQAVFDTPNGQKFFSDLDSRKDFFNAYANAVYAKGDEVAWPRAAAQVSADLALTWTAPDFIPGITSTQSWINETGNVILDSRWGDLKSLYASSSPLVGKDAHAWDINTLVTEQMQLQPQYDKLQSGAAFWSKSGAAIVPWFFHPLNPSLPVLDLTNPYARIGQGLGISDQINLRNWVGK